MKITTFILFAALMQVSAAGIAQRLSLPKQDISLKELFNQINQQTSYTVAWSATQVNADQQVHVDFNNTPLPEVLDQTLKNTNLSYTIENKTVVIKQKEQTFLEKAKAYFATVTISGKVVNELGEPMPGVNVREKGTQNGTTTDEKGAFNLTVANSDALINFTYVGYEPKEISVKELPNGAVITLKAAENSLQEVVISKGYYNEKRSLSTGDVSVVGAKTIEEQPVTDPIQALEGRVPGLLISQTSGLPGAYATIRLRGQNSIANGNDPLYIIDGVPFSSASMTSAINVGRSAVGNPIKGQNYSNGAGLSPFNALNPEDIENIEVLKDADATAIYGSRGANGVILITTKKGKAGKVKVDFSLSQGAGKVTRTMDMMNTQQYLQMEHQAFANDGLPFPSIAANSQDPNYDTNGVWDTTRNTNWQKVFLGNTAHYTNAQLSLSGGSETTQFYIGSGFSRQNTVFPGSDDDAKGSMDFSLSHTSADHRFQIQFSGGYTYDDNTLPPVDLTQAALNSPSDAPPLYEPNGSLNWQLYNGTATSYVAGILAYTLQSNESITNKLNGDLLLSYQLLPGLKLQSSFGYTDERMSQSNQVPSTSIAPPDNLITTNRENQFANTELSNWIIEPQLSYNRDIGKGKLNVQIGGTLQQNVSNEIGFTSSGYNNDALIANPANAATLQLAGFTNSLYRYEAIYARIGYTWEDKYLLNLTANRDGSSRFGPANQWGNFWAIGTGWVFSKEKFVESALPWLSFGKLRASYGVTGNDQIPDYGYLSSYSTVSNAYQGSNGLAPTRLPNPYYGWEVDRKLEGGIELGFLKDRINFTASYYRNRTGNQLVGYALPSFSGFITVQENLPAVVQNTGAEFELHTVNIQSGGFRWTTDINLTIPNNKLISYPNLASSSYKNTYVLGQSLFIQKLFTGTKVNPADGQYEWLSADGSYTENPNSPADLRATPPLTPKYYGSFGNSFSYKGFQLDVFFEFRKQLGYNYWAAGLESPGTPGFNQPVAIIANTWTTAGQQAKYGKLSTENAADPNYNNFSSLTDFDISDASFIRLKNVAFSWTLPTSWQHSVHVSNARIFLNAQNLLTFTNYFGLDPENNQSPGSLPPLRMITLGLRSSF